MKRPDYIEAPPLKKAPETNISNSFDAQVVQKSHIDFLYELHSKGIPLSKDQYQLLVDNDLIQILPPPPKEFTGPLSPTKPNEQASKEIEEKIEKRKKDRLVNQEVIQKDVYETDVLDERELIYDIEIGVKRSDWQSESIIHHSKEFTAWINSINSGFRNRIRYELFELYKLQAEEWMEDSRSLDEYDDEEERFEYMIRELERCSINSLYAANKYYWLKDEAGTIGKIKYFATDFFEHQRVCAYLFDCGYSVIIGKPRQPGITSIYGILGMNRVLNRKNYFLKFIAENAITAEEIFEDKIKFSFESLDGWFQPNTNGKPDVVNDRDRLFKIGRKGAKGTIEGLNSKIVVSPPYKTAINGGSPPLVFIDEIGSIDILTEMMNEGRPTMFRRNRITGVFEIKGQICAWGCLCAGMKVWTNNGDLINIEDLIPEQGILGYNNESISKEEITYWQPPKEKECYRITTNTGRYIECSHDHPILWSKGMWGTTPKPRGKTSFVKYIDFKEAEHIKIGDQLAIIEEASVFGKKRLWEPRFLGWAIGDGSYKRKKVCVISNADHEIHDYIQSTFDCSTEKEYITKDGRDYKDIRIRGISEKLKEAGLRGKDVPYKVLPKNINSCTKEDICEFLGGYFDADGCVHYTKNSRSIELTSSSYELLDGVRFLLQKVGVHCTITRVKAKPEPGSKDKNDWHILLITDKKSLIAFYKNIFFRVKYKQIRLGIVIDKISGTESKVPRMVRFHKEKGHGTKNHGLRFEKVVQVENVGMKPVYNLTAGTTNTYIANGIVTHNTGTTGKGGGAFENEWKRIVGLWNEHNYTAGLIPLFFDWTTRCSDEEYLSQKAYYYGARAKDEGIDIATSKIQFHQHYPSSPSDMFSTTKKTIVDRETIDTNLKRIYSIDPLLRPQPGYFEPIFDKTRPMDENSDVPYRIIGANFIPVEEISELATAIMFQRPKKNWIDRYYQGTDPISADTGTSWMASAIWDAFYNTVPCLVNHRELNNPDASFLQCLLMGLYYDPIKNQGVPELIEKNIGLAYKKYKTNKGFLGNMMYSAELPDHLKSGVSKDIGVDNKGYRNKAIINEMYKVFTVFANKIYIPTPFEQLKTFVCDITRAGNESWGPVDSRYYRDDSLWAIVFSYIAAQGHIHRIPTNIEEEAKTIKIEWESYYDESYNLKRRPRRVVKESA